MLSRAFRSSDHQYYGDSDSPPLPSRRGLPAYLAKPSLTFRPQPRDASRIALSVTFVVRADFRASPWMSRLAIASSAESGSLSYGLSVRLRLLPTPPRDDAVAFGYGVVTTPMRTCTALI